MLFTADLKTFSERLSTKIEMREIKEEGDAIVGIEAQVKTIKTPLNVKREHEEENVPLLGVEEDITTKRAGKRRRKAGALDL